MAEYLKTRTLLTDGRYCLESSPANDLISDLETAIPGVKFNLSGEDNSMSIITDRALTGGEQSTLDTTLQNFINTKVFSE